MRSCSSKCNRPQKVNFCGFCSDWKSCRSWASPARWRWPSARSWGTRRSRSWSFWRRTCGTQRRRGKGNEMRSGQRARRVRRRGRSSSNAGEVFSQIQGSKDRLTVWQYEFYEEFGRRACLESCRSELQYGTLNRFHSILDRLLQKSSQFRAQRAASTPGLAGFAQPTGTWNQRPNTSSHQFWRKTVCIVSCQKHDGADRCACSQQCSCSQGRQAARAGRCAGMRWGGRSWWCDKRSRCTRPQLRSKVKCCQIFCGWTSCFHISHQQSSCPSQARQCSSIRRDQWGLVSSCRWWSDADFRQYERSRSGHSFLLSASARGTCLCSPIRATQRTIGWLYWKIEICHWMI